MKILLRWCWFVLAASVSATCASAQATNVTRRLSSVLLRPPPAAVARVLPRPAAPVAAMANASAAQTTAPLVLAARARLATEYGAATTTTIAGASLITSPDSAARGLAHSIYGGRAQLATVRVVNTQTFGVWVGDTAEKQKAPSGLDVREGVVLPYRYVRVDSATGRVMALKPWLDDGGGLRYDAKEGGYVATLRIGLRDSLQSDRTVTLSPAIMLSVAAAADEVSPDTLSIVQTNVFAKRTHLLTRRSTRGMQVTLYPDFSDRGVTVWIVVQPDSVVLRPEKQSVNAFGLGDAQFTVSLSSGVAPGDSVPVTLDADGGTIRDAMVVYPKGAGSATARVHFEGLGTHRVTARAGVLTMAEATVHVTFPYALLFGAVLGALAGSFLFALKDRDRPDTTAIWWVLLSGVITGVLVAAIAAIGAFKLGGLSLPQGGGALASFVAGALGGFSGPKLLSKFAGGDDGGTKKPPG